jgi:hypothetical protein
MVLALCPHLERRRAVQRILKHSRYNPGRGGHAPGDLRDAFVEAVDALQGFQPGAPLPTVEVREQTVPVTAMFRLLWNCPDQLPWSDYQAVCELLGDDENAPKRVTYDAASRKLLALYDPQAQDAG